MTSCSYVFPPSVAVATLCLWFAGCSSTPPRAPQPTTDSPGLTSSVSRQPSLLDRPGIVYENYGIEVKTIMLTANDHLLDFRFEVIDAEKAKRLFGRDRDPRLVDQASGAVLIVPTPPKVGALRQTSYEPAEGRIHFILFANPGGILKRGSTVSVVIDEFRADNLVVE